MKTNFKNDTSSEAFEQRKKEIEKAFNMWYIPLVRYVVSLGNTWATAEEIVMNVFLFVTSPRYAGKKIIYPYLRRQAFQKSVDWHRKEQRRPLDFREDIPEISTPFQRETPFSKEELKAEEQSFWSEFPDVDLSDKHKRLLWGHARLGYTIQELADQESMAKSTVHDAISFAKKKLVEYINSQ